MEKNSGKRIIVPMDKKLHTDLKIQALREGTTITELCTRLFLRYLNSKVKTEDKKAA